MCAIIACRHSVRFLLFSGMALLASGLFLPEALGQFGRPPGFPNIPTPPRQTIPTPPRYTPSPIPISPPEFVKVWSCLTCLCELGRGPEQPPHTSCPRCKTVFTNSVSPQTNLPPAGSTPPQPNAWNNNNNNPGGNFPPASGGSTSPAMANPGVRNPNALVDPNTIRPPLQNNYPQVTTPSPSTTESSSTSGSSGRSMKIFIIIGGALFLLLIAGIIAVILITKVISKPTTRSSKRVQ